jgi:hypothetical protein
MGAMYVPLTGGVEEDTCKLYGWNSTTIFLMNTGIAWGVAM